MIDLMAVFLVIVTPLLAFVKKLLLSAPGTTSFVPFLDGQTYLVRKYSSPADVHV
jgi:hypothetical protein